MGEHDCCKKGSNHKDSSQSSKSCPHSQFTPQAYDRVHQLETVVSVSTMVAEMPVVVSLPAVQEAVQANTLLPDTHAPPGTYLRISVIRI